MAEGFFSDRKQLVVIAFLFLISYFAIYSLNYIDSSLTGIPYFGTMFPGYDWAFESPRVSPMYVLMPALGFVSVYFLIHWTKREMEWDFMRSWPFLLLFIVFCLLAFFFALYFFYLPQYLNVSSQGGIFYTCFYRYELDWEKVPGVDIAEKKGNAVAADGANCLWNSCIACDLAKVKQREGLVQTTLCQMNFPKCFGSSPFFVFMLGGIAAWISFRAQKIIEKLF